MESKSCILIMAPLVLGLLSISLCSVSANPMPQNFARQQNYRSNYGGLNSFNTGGSRQLQPAYDSGHSNRFGNNNNYYPTHRSGQPNIPNSGSGNAEPNDGQLSVMLSIPQWFARFGVAFVQEPNLKTDRGRDENNANANNECQGAECGLPQEPASSSADYEADDEISTDVEGPGDELFMCGVSLNSSSLCHGSVSEGPFGGFGGGGFGGGSSGGFGGGGSPNRNCPQGQRFAPHSGRCVKSSTSF